MNMLRRQMGLLLVIMMLAASVTFPAPPAKAASEGAPATVYAYEPSPRYAASVNYTLKANGVEIPVIQAYADYDYANFSVSEGPVTYELTILNTDRVHEYSISPKKLGITADKVEGRTITFTTDSDEYLIVMMNSRKTRIVIAADPLETDVPAASGTGIYNITEAPYLVEKEGGQTGVSERTAAIQRAIDDASAYGTAQGGGSQGIVYVPRGTYYIGNLVLKSNTALYMEPGAAFVGTGKTSDYTEHWFKDSMGRPATWWISTAFDSSNIKIYGRGTIDGNGKLLHDDKSVNGKGMINNLVVPIATEHFVMDGIIIRESAAWAVMPVRSNDLTFTNLKMFNSLGMGENDGIDIVESQNAVIRNTIGIALDDPYSTKAWREDTDIASGAVPWPGSPEPVDNVLFEDAISWTLCYGYKIGQGVMQDQRNITFRDAVVYKAAVGFAIHHKYGTGKVSNVTFENIDVEDISGKNEDNSAWMTMFTVDSGGNGVGPVTGVTVKNINVRDAGESFSKMKGMPGAMITDVRFENIYMPGSAEPAATLHEMNFLSKEYYGSVTILPVQEPEPRPRTNLALHRPAVISSNDGAEDTARYSFDGNLATRSGTKRGIDPGWLYVDLGEARTINRVHLVWEAAYGRSYRIQVTNEDPSVHGDATNWTDVYSTTAGKGGLEEIAFDEVEARYVRMYGTVRATQYGYSLWEMEVYGPEIFVDSIALDRSELHLALGETAQLTATLLPENATNKQVIWLSSNPGAAAVDVNGKVTAMGTGSAYITARTQNGELTATASVTVTDPAAETVRIAPSDSNIHYIGRWDTTTPDKYTSYWPGASFRTGFTGSRAYLSLGSEADIYVQIDDGNYVQLENASGTVNLTPVPLTDGEHTLTVVAKDIVDAISFEGLLLERGETTLPVRPKKHLIEFVGDSITVGYRMPDVALDSYAWLASEQLNADHTQIAYTGICLQTGVTCYAPNSLGMSEQYFKLQTGDFLQSPDWDFTRYEPDAVVLNLGTNDDKFGVSDADFQNTYTEFLANIRERYPDAHLLVLRTIGGFMTEPTKAAVQSRSAAGDDKVHFIDTAGWVDAYPSADFIDSLHPSESGHVKIANRLAGILETYLAEQPEPQPENPCRLGCSGPSPAPGGSNMSGPGKAVITINGKEETALGLESKELNGVRTTTVKLSADALGGGLDTEGDRALVSIELPAGDGQPDVAVGELDGALIKEMGDSHAVLRLVTEASAYELPMQLLNLQTLLGEDAQDAAVQTISLRIRIAKASDEQLKAAEDAEREADFKLAGSPVDFKVELLTGERSIEVTSFGAYTGRWIALPESADPRDIYAGIELRPDGAVRYVPAATIRYNGRDYVKLSSMTNSVYAIVQAEPEFKDMSGHWAEAPVYRMGARFVVNGTPDGEFLPDQAVTRAEFAAMIIRALGLEYEAEDAPSFGDVSSSDWYHNAVQSANQHGLVKGFGNGVFRPEDSITREQAMSIAARAAGLTGSVPALTREESEKLLGAFADSSELSAWAESGVAFSLREGMTNGRDGGTIAPQSPITRAEAAVLIERMLEKLGLTGNQDMA